MLPFQKPTWKGASAAQFGDKKMSHQAKATEVHFVIRSKYKHDYVGWKDSDEKKSGNGTTSNNIYIYQRYAVLLKFLAFVSSLAALQCKKKMLGTRGT